MGTQSSIPRLYRVLFTWIDGAISLLVAYIHFFDVEGATREHFPQLQDVPISTFKPFFFPIGGSMLFASMVQLGLLRYSADVKAWKIVQFGLILQDISMLLSMVEIIRGRDQLMSFADISQTGAFSGLVMVGGRTLVRVAFLGGLGLERPGKTVKQA
ncbi:unnamed protein product [Clonostachys rosea]|uniref:Uncharacterized protein n=1 Tax=Bionectria ochroleuca TaxID=29856 RepID=A0ABY6UER2_BIOOC|nr:unnamed protein product [Clonostachys rosea]